MSAVVNPGEAIAPDRAAAEEFLRKLDADAVGFSFQTFDDSPAKRRELVRVLHGSLDQYWAILCELSARGAGVYITVNRTDLKGRKKENVTEVRSLFTDLDGVPLANCTRLAMEPHVGVTTSPGRFHLYWKVGGIGLDEAPGLQRRLAALMDGDPKIADLPHVMRLPGFPHQKSAPFMVRAGYSNASATSRDEFMAALAAGEHAHGIAQAEAKQDALEPTNVIQGPFAPGREYLKQIALANKRSGFNEAAGNVSAPPPLNEQEINRVASALKLISSEDRDTWLKVGMALHWTGWTRAGIAREMWDMWSRGSTKFNEQVQEATWQSFDRGYGSTKITLGTLFHMAKEKGWIDPSPPAPAVPVQHPEGRVVVNLTDGEGSSIVDKCERILTEDKAKLYVRPWKNGMAFVTPHEKDVQTISGGTARQVRFQAHDASSIEYLLGQHIDFTKTPWRGPLKHVDPPKNICEMLLRKANGETLFPTIDGIICAPTLRMDGSLLDQPGHDEKTRLLLVLETGFKMQPLPKAPTRDDALAALKLLSDLLDEFPFESEVDQAVALSTLITPTLRGTMSIAPLHVIRARQAGTGKTFLVDVASLIATGEECASITAGKDEELTKQLISVIREGAPIISLDNCNHELDGEFLASMLSKTEVRARTLGRSEAPRYENKAMVLANGNNIKVAGDMTRRTVLCRLDAKRARPETRRFEFNPKARVCQDRAKYIRAILVITRAYRAACARGEGLNLLPLNNYEQWSETVREPLIWLGCRDPVESQETVREEDPRENELLLLVTNWPHDHSRTKEGGLTARDLIDIAGEMAGANADGPFKHQALRELLFRVAGRGREIDGNSLGQWLSGFEGHRVDSGQYISIKRNPKGHRYVLENG